MSQIRLSSIVAIAQNHVIGKDNTLIWHIPEDLKHFKRTTMGKPIIMGRKSYEALGKPLPGRANIVISRSHTQLSKKNTTHFDDMESVETEIAKNVKEGPFLCSSINEAIEIAKQHAAADGLDEVFIMGGGEIYKQTMPIIERLYITVIHRDYEGDTHFPQFNWDAWTKTEITEHEASGALPAFTIYTLDRKA